ncbi:MAG: 50S ribosomal protein L11 methyltransferase [Anaerolineales bacterium]|nr:50S ribosomal protein L11 methyltransferase [Anaerolineales bacterium]MCB9128350.1 50S ribosomal protein L11 methyltransferase [Ardenticatenales bacterium]MCB9172162.1 50S ribosomal protein L11 methyltransferase [Ardenticatenales bacterium]
MSDETTMDWIEVTVSGVDGEAAEALSEVIGRYAQGGAVIEQIVSEGFAPSASPHPLAVKGYLPDGPAAEQPLRKLREALWHLSVILPMPEPTVRHLAREDWAESWKQHYRRLKPGARLVVIPAWDEATVDADELPIRMDPGMAFGTGTHPSTQLCLRLLERHLRAGDRVFDVGTGSGILSIGAQRLGAGRVVASDVDAVAIRAAAENAALNEMAGQIELRVGSADAFDGPFDLILINILAEIIVQLLADARARLVAGGRILLAGIIAEREPLVRAKLDELALTVIEREQIDDWVGLAVAGQA